MNLKIYILKKKQILWTTAIIVALILAAVAFLSIRAAQSMNYLSVASSLKADLNNDGKVDSVVVKTDVKSKDYIISVICSDENGYQLQPDPVIKTLGKADSKAPVNITFKDIDNDKCEEMFIQSADSHGPILHVFGYANNNMERIVSGRYFIYGNFVNTSSNENLLALASRSKDKITFSFLKQENGQLVPYSADKSMNLGSKRLGELMGTIEDDALTAMSLNLDQKSSAAITKGQLLDGILSNVEITDFDTPAKCTYTLRSVQHDRANQKGIEPSFLRVQLSMNNADVRNPDYSITKIENIRSN